MPSVPQSLLWIVLIGLWLFVLVPMLVKKRPSVKETSDAALATRVLHTGGKVLAARHMAADRLRARTSTLKAKVVGESVDPDATETTAPAENAATAEVVEPVVAEDADLVDTDLVDTDSVDGGMVDTDSAADADSAQDAEIVDESVEEPAAEEPVQPETARAATSREDVVVPKRRRGGYDPQADEAIRAERYVFRQRVTASLAVLLIGALLVGFTLSSVAMWVAAVAGVALVGYLGYLRRQTAIEEDIRRRRLARARRARLGVESRSDAELAMVPMRLRRPGAIVLEIDDEDPVFEHLDYYTPPRVRDLPRAVGQ